MAYKRARDKGKYWHWFINREGVKVKLVYRKSFKGADGVSRALAADNRTDWAYKVVQHFIDAKANPNGLINNYDEATWRDMSIQYLKTIEDTTSVGNYVRVKGHWDRYILPHLGSDKVSKTISEEYQEFAEKLTSERGALVAREVFVVVTSFIRWCIEENKCISSNPIKASLRKYIRVNRENVRSKKKRKQNEYPLKTRDVKLIFDYIPERREAVVYHSMAHTARIGEALGVRVKDINIFKGTLKFDQQIQSYPKDMLKGTRYQDDTSIDKNGSARVLDQLKTEDSHRTVKLIPETVELFRKAIEGKDPDDLIFTTRNGTPCTPDNFRKRYWKPMLRKLGLDHKTKLTPHVMRTYVFSKGVSAGKDSALLSRNLGHKNISVTMQNYFTDIEDDNQVHSLDHMSEVVGGDETIKETETTDRAFKVVGE